MARKETTQTLAPIATADLPPGEYWEYTSNTARMIQYTELNTQYEGAISIQ
mgnify:CR=1 FL=1